MLSNAFAKQKITICMESNPYEMDNLNSEPSAGRDGVTEVAVFFGCSVVSKIFDL